MTAQELVKQNRYREWASMVTNCQGSGKSVCEWCEAEGLSTKVYYYRRKKLREVLFAQAVEAGQLGEKDRNGTLSPRQEFVALPSPGHRAPSADTPSQNKVAVTVRIGGYTVEVNSGADAEIIANVMKAVASL